jgi:hypothetical protein
MDDDATAVQNSVKQPMSSKSGSLLFRVSEIRRAQRGELQPQKAIVSACRRMGVSAKTTW